MDYDYEISEKLMKGEEATFKKIANHIRYYDDSEFEDAVDNGIFDEEWFEDLIIDLANRIKFRRKLIDFIYKEES